MRVRERHALPRQPIEVRRGQAELLVELGERVVAHVVGEDDDDVRALRPGKPDETERESAREESPRHAERVAAHSGDCADQIAGFRRFRRRIPAAAAKTTRAPGPPFPLPQRELPMNKLGCLLSVPLLAAACLAQVPAPKPTPRKKPRAEWSLTAGVTGTPSQRRDNPGAASDTHLYVFGGRLGNATSTVLNALYEFDGKAWTLKTAEGAPGSPPKRGGAAVAWDFARNKLVVFGGDAGSSTTLLNDTWEWDRARPTPGAQVKSANAPSARRWSAMAWDPITKGMVLFGGLTASGYSDETWLLIGGQWSSRSLTIKPPARSNHSFVTRPDFRDAVVTGGQDNSQTPGRPAPRRLALGRRRLGPDPDEQHRPAQHRRQPGGLRPGPQAHHRAGRQRHQHLRRRDALRHGLRRLALDLVQRVRLRQEQVAALRRGCLRHGRPGHRPRQPLLRRLHPEHRQGLQGQRPEPLRARHDHRHLRVPGRPARERRRARHRLPEPQASRASSRTIAPGSARASTPSAAASPAAPSRSA